MLKYAKIINTNTKQCEVGLGSNEDFYKSIGMTKQDVEQSPDGFWFLYGYAPKASLKNYKELREEAYPSISDQLDMIYWDKINGTSVWSNKISEIKNKYPKN